MGLSVEVLQHTLLMKVNPSGETEEKLFYSTVDMQLNQNALLVFVCFFLCFVFFFVFVCLFVSVQLVNSNHTSSLNSLGNFNSERFRLAKNDT